MTKRKPKAQHKRPGPPPTPIDLALVERLAQRQGSIREIAACVGIDEKALRRRIKRDHELSAAIKRGHKLGCMTLRTRMWNSAMEGVPSIQIFLAKNYLGMADKTNTELTGKEGGPVQVANTYLDLVKSATKPK